MEVTIWLVGCRCLLATRGAASLLSTPVMALATGTPDPGFGIGGRITKSLDVNIDRLHAFQVRVDERIDMAAVTAPGPSTSNNLTVVRYPPSPMPDTDSGSGGITRLVGGAGPNDIAYALAVQPDRKMGLDLASAYRGRWCDVADPCSSKSQTRAMVRW